MKSESLKISAFVLHSKAYQESSLILQVFSLELGRLSIIAKGVKNKSSQARKAQLQPFSPLFLEYTGKSELKTLIRCERVNPSTIHSLQYSDKAMACAYYASELILRALPEHQEFAEIFFAYEQLVSALSANQELSLLLRRFEIILLRGIGIAPDFEIDIHNRAIESEQHYYLMAQKGFCRVEPDMPTTDKPTIFSGRCILALNQGNLLSEDLLQAQLITRNLLREVIGNKPLQSRKLWQHIHLNQN